MTNSPLSDQAIAREQAFLPIGEATPVEAGERIKATVMARPSDNMIAWSVELPRSGRRFSHSTWQGDMLGAADLRLANPDRTPRLSRAGRTHAAVLSYCDGRRTAKEIEELVSERACRSVPDSVGGLPVRRRGARSGYGVVVELTRSPPRAQTPWTIAPFHAWEPTDGEPWAQFYRSGDGILVRFPDYADFELSSDGRRVVCAPAPDVSPETIEHLYFNQILPLVLSGLGRLVFHASAVEIEGFAVAFPAPSGRGKSSLAAAFAADGNPFLTDDGLVLETIGGWLRGPTQSAVAAALGGQPGAVRRPGDGTAAPVSYTAKVRLLAGKRLAHCNSPRRLLAAYFLGDGAATDIVFRPLSAVEGLIEWAKHSFMLDVQDQGLIAAHFDRVAALAKAVPCVALDYPRNYDVLPDVLRAIRVQVRNASPSP